jgi:hypothetical protein
MSLHTVAADLLEDLGAPYTLRRKSVAAGANDWTAGVATITYLPQRGHRRFADSHIVEGAVRDPGGRVCLSPNYATPVIGDQLAEGTITSDTGILWREITHVDTVSVEGFVAKHICQCRV